MKIFDIFDESDHLANELLEVIDLPLINNSSKIRTSDVSCSLSLEHWHCARLLLRNGLLPSAVVVHRAQFEALTRSIWLAYAASDKQVSKLTADITLESEQSAKNMPQISQMMCELEKNVLKKYMTHLLVSKTIPGKRSIHTHIQVFIQSEDIMMVILIS